MNKPYGAAVVITEDNRAQLAIINGGLVPSKENLEAETYFVFPYDPDAYVDIMSAAAFAKKYYFNDTPNAKHLVDISLR